MALIPLTYKLDWYNPSEPGGTISTINNNANLATSFDTQYSMQDIIDTVAAGGGIPWPYQYDVGLRQLIQGENPGATGDAVTAYGVQALVSITSGVSNTAIGTGAGNTLSTGFANTLIGREAGYSMNADKSVIIGSNAGYNITTSTENTIIGSGAGYDLDIGSSNVLIGNLAAENITNGVGNVVVGAEALTAISASVGHNSAIGYEALQNTFNSDNVALGYQAGRANTDGFGNIFIGGEAGSQNATGLTGDGNTLMGYLCGVAITGAMQDNVWIGRYAAQSVDDGSDSVIIGGSAGRTANNVIGSTIVGALAGQTARQYSTLFGLRAGFNITTNGEDNVCLGAYAGDSITDGDLNLMVGHSADIGTNTDSNSIAIGAQAQGAGSNTVVLGNSNITSWQPGADDTVSLGDKATRGFKELILVSPDGTRWSVTVDNAGNLVVA